MIQLIYPRRFHRLSLLVGLAVGLGLAPGCKESTPPIEQTPPPSVTVCRPAERDVYEYVDFVGCVDAVKSVEISARVTGYLNKICFQEGAEVKAGDLLYEIDPRPFQAVYDAAVAQIQLCEANLKYTKAELKRAEELIVTNAVSRSDYDRDVAAHAQAVATLAAAKARAEEAKLNLGFTKLYSPINGEISRTQITEGNLVQADQTLLTKIVSVDPMYVYFDADEQTILKLQQEVREGKLQVNESVLIPIWMRLDTERGYPHQGYLNFMENRYDSTTGTIRCRAEFPNPMPARGRRVLMPGNNANLRLIIGRPTKGIWVPERAIQSEQSQKYVLVVNAKNEVEYRRVKLGWLSGQMRILLEGVRPDDHVIVNGMQRVRPGMTVVPKLVSLETIVGKEAAESPSGEVLKQLAPLPKQRGEK